MIWRKNYIHVLSAGTFLCKRVLYLVGHANFMKYQTKVIKWTEKIIDLYYDYTNHHINKVSVFKEWPELKKHYVSRKYLICELTQTSVDTERQTQLWVLTQCLINKHLYVLCVLTQCLINKHLYVLCTKRCVYNIMYVHPFFDHNILDLLK